MEVIEIMETVKTEAKPKTWGVLAEFASPEAVYHAAEKVRDRGFRKWDVYSPFPIHGIDKAMGAGDSKVGWLALFGAITGAFGGFGLQYWMNVYAQPVLIGGKPLNSYPAFVPVTFEPGILLTAFSCLLGMLALNGLPRLYHAVFRSRNFHRASDNGFFIGIEARDPKFNVSDVRKLLEDAGGRNIEVLED
jgi:hypothetical protein